ncbi:MAG: hypothetical protein WAQ28_12420 [Bacteroidia bacterium]
MYTKKYLYSFALWLLSLTAFAQGATIRAKKIKWNISVSAVDTVLWIAKKNLLVIDIQGGMNYKVEIKGAKWKNTGNKYSVEVFTEGSTMLTVYEKLPDNKMRPVFTKLYKVMDIPEPVPYVCSVKADSVIDKLQIIKEDNITVFSAYYNTQVPVLGFDVIVSFGGQSDTLTSTCNHFTLDMKRRIHYLVPGSILYFENVYCAMPDGKIQMLKPFEIYIDETNKYKVGYRLLSGNN